jgi:3-hydroxybutyryl-CoA dehydrogenase
VAPEQFRQQSHMKVAVVGCGYMGTSIAAELAKAASLLLLYDSDTAAAKAALTTARQLTDMRQLENRVCSLEELGEVDLVIEAVYEDVEVKRAVFAQLEQHCSPTAVLATNTSSLSLTELSRGLQHPERFMACHFLHPAHLMPLVELAPAPQTQPEAMSRVRDFLEACGKSPIVLAREMPGFVAARLQAALLREALALVDAGVCSVQDVDAAVTRGFGRRLPVVGPIQVADLAGLDLHVATLNALYPTLDNSTRAPDSLVSRVDRGDVGAKSGQGYYEWEPRRLAAVQGERDGFLRMLLMLDSAARQNRAINQQQ